MYNDISSGAFFAIIIIWFYPKKREENNFASFTQIFQLVIWNPKYVNPKYVMLS